ncbi:uncharacterized protein LOC106143586 [Amyelois transitella]|uniref:uncharacterized protein LOC106143586 n=1 Tax=Amyelois transitella TaxID=680683 RepID=UPI00298F5D5A|nr:uncharacterized protein LOC106143586 [Amyelois transitella]
MGPLVKNAARRARSVPVRIRYLFLLATVCGGSFFIFCISSNTLFFFNNELSPSTHGTQQRNTDDPSDSFTIKTIGCTIPRLDPYHKSIKDFIKRPPEVICPRSKNYLLSNNDTHIWIEMDNMQHYDISNESNFSCCYRSFYRPLAITDVTAKNADDRVRYNPCVYFFSYIEVMHEFVRVTCGNGVKTVYDQFFLFAPLKKISSQKDYLNIDTPRKINNTLNVIVMGIDAISRLNFQRTMPRTFEYLRKKGAIELLGYNKVGDNTFPNLAPMLLGLRETELKKTCWPNLKSRFDNCPFIWEWYKEAGYLTALGEDSGQLGTFNYGRFGFLSTPTDYYIRTFIREAELRVGNTKDYNSFVCMGNKLFYEVLLDYIQLLTTTLKSSRLFGFFWEVTFSHDFLNYPMLMDKNYEALLHHLDKTKYLDETVLILLSDHGMRWGEIRNTKQGRLEERLPFVHILVPPSFQQNYSLAYNNLKTNSRRLSTPFDIHATLSDLLYLDGLRDDNIKSRSRTAYANDRSISLFLPLPSNRTCKMADVDDHWCTCHNYTVKLTTDSPEVQEAAVNLVRKINSMTADYLQCARLILADILDASEIVGRTQQDEEGWREIVLLIRTTPGDGLFEATLRREAEKWVVAGGVSRLNLYGDQSHCVHNYLLKLYCYCK